MLLAFQVSELQYPAYTSDYKHGRRGVPFPIMDIRDRSLNRQTSDYTHAQISYIKRLAFPHFLRSSLYGSSALWCYKPFLRSPLVMRSPIHSVHQLSLSHLAVMSPYNYFLTTHGHFISVKHSNKVNGVKVSFVHLTWWCLWLRLHSQILHVGYES